MVTVSGLGFGFRGLGLTDEIFGFRIPSPEDEESFSSDGQSCTSVSKLDIDQDWPRVRLPFVLGESGRPASLNLGDCRGQSQP